MLPCKLPGSLSGVFPYRGEEDVEIIRNRLDIFGISWTFLYSVRYNPVYNLPKGAWVVFVGRDFISNVIPFCNYKFVFHQVPIKLKSFPVRPVASLEKAPVKLVSGPHEIFNLFVHKRTWPTFDLNYLDWSMKVRVDWRASLRLSNLAFTSFP